MNWTKSFTTIGQMRARRVSISGAVGMGSGMGGGGGGVAVQEMEGFLEDGSTVVPEPCRRSAAAVGVFAREMGSTPGDLHAGCAWLATC